MMYLCSLWSVVVRGAIPGLFRRSWYHPDPADDVRIKHKLKLAMLLGMYVGGVSGSFIAAVLVGTLVSAASIR